MRQAGMSLIEVVVTVAIAGVLLGLGLQSFNTMIASTQSRSTAESILSGLRIARAEAIRRNVPVRFQLVSSMDAGCDFSSTSPLWVITQTDWAITPGVTAPPTDGKSHGRTRFDGTGYCNALPYNPPDRPDPCNPDVPVGTEPGKRPVGNPATCSDDPWIVTKSTANPRPTVTVAANSSIVTFGPLGQVLPNIESVATPAIASLATVNVNSTNSEAKNWRVRVEVGDPALPDIPGSGAIKFCDPSITDPTHSMFC